MILERNPIRDALVGLAVGDALGVPVESFSREELKKYPVQDMRAYGRHSQPRGTWSDKSALAFCLAESLCQTYDLQDIAVKFVHWNSRDYWTARGEVFDIEYDTKKAISRLSAMLYLKEKVTPISLQEIDNEIVTNGALVRILPLAFFLLDKPLKERFQKISEVSALTHGHLRSILACFILIEFARRLILGDTKKIAYRKMQKTVSSFVQNAKLEKTEIAQFSRILHQCIYQFPENEIKTSEGVVDTIEAGLWAVLIASNYKSTVLKAVNLGENTDTTAGIAGGLAGIIYGLDEIPEKWRTDLARIGDIIQLGERLEEATI